MKTFKSLKSALLLTAATLAATGLAASIHQPAYAQEAVRTYNIEAQDLNGALREFAMQTGRDVLYAPEIVAGRRSPGVRGRHTEEQALQVLLAETGLSYERTGSNGYAIRGPGAPVQRSGADAATAVELSSVVVTGTRIERPASQIAAHVIVLRADDLEATGEITLARALRQLPQNVFGTTEFGSVIGGSANGAQNVTGGSTINLRGLGSESTLILVDGRRIGQSGLFGGGSDISSIPISAVERVEIMLDGASSVYGSDAVGGVVNIILKKDYHGAELAYTHGAPDQGGFEEHLVSLSGGFSWGSGRIRGSYEYFSTSELDGSERRSSGLGPFGSPANAYSSGTPLFYRYNGQNYLPSQLPGLGLTPASPGVEAIFRAQLPAGHDGIGMTVADITNLGTTLTNNNIGRSLIPELDRHTWMSGIEQDFRLFGGDITAFADIFYSTRDARAGAGAPTFNASVPTTNAFNPFEGSFFENTNLLVLVPNLPSPYFNTTVDTLRWNAGIRGRIGRWSWTMSGGESHEEIDSLRHNTIVDLVAIANLLNQGLNLFATDIVAANDPALVAQLQAGPLSAASTNSLSVFSADFAGPLFQLPGGAVRLAVGTELGKTSLDTQSEVSVSQGGGSQSVPGGAYSPTLVSVEKRSVYGELLVPIIGPHNAVPLVNQLTLTGSARHDDYNRYGDATTWSAGLVWSPNSEMILRVNRATSFVVPTPREALVPPHEFNLLALIGRPGPVPVVDQHGAYTGAFDLQAGFISGGNPNLEPETADTLSVRGEFRPRIISNLVIGATWHETSYDNRISITPISLTGFYPQDLIDFPDLVYRDENGYLFFDRRSVNIASVETQGVDYDVHYNFSNRYGDFTLRANVAHTNRWRQRNSPTAAVVDLVGESSSATFNVIPEYRYSAALMWNFGGVAAALDFSSASSTTSPYNQSDIPIYTENGTLVPPSTPLRRTFDYPLLVDLSVSLDLDHIYDGRFAAGTSLTFRVNNLLEEQPSVVKTITSSGERVDESLFEDFNVNIADPRGRVFYVGLRRRF